eukprot:6481387-Amphidinium_carterae.2
MFCARRGLVWSYRYRLCFGGGVWVHAVFVSRNVPPPGKKVQILRDLFDSTVHTDETKPLHQSPNTIYQESRKANAKPKRRVKAASPRTPKHKRKYAQSTIGVCGSETGEKTQRIDGAYYWLRAYLCAL